MTERINNGRRKRKRDACTTNDPQDAPNSKRTKHKLATREISSERVSMELQVEWVLQVMC